MARFRPSISPLPLLTPAVALTTIFSNELPTLDLRFVYGVNRDDSAGETLPAGHAEQPPSLIGAHWPVPPFLCGRLLGDSGECRARCRIIHVHACFAGEELQITLAATDM